MDTEGQELGPYEPVPDTLVLAAIERAVGQGLGTVWPVHLGEHLGFRRRGHMTRKLSTAPRGGAPTGVGTNTKQEPEENDHERDQGIQTEGNRLSGAMAIESRFWHLGAGEVR